MAFEMNQLQGFMRLGPQVYPARPNAAMVIKRGPHGKRIAADPVAVRLGKERGSGFRFWVEDLNVPRNQAWNPPQAIVGLLGIQEAADATATFASDVVARATGGRYGEADIQGAKALGCSTKAPPLPDFGPSPGSGGAARNLWSDIRGAAAAACRGRVAAARRLLDGSWDQWSGWLSTSDEVNLRTQFRKAHSYIDQTERVSEQLIAETVAREAKRGQAISKWSAENAASERASDKEGLRCAKLGKASYAAYSVTGTCPDIAIPDTKKIVAGALLAGVALVAVYGLASGFGRGVAGR